MKTNKIFLIVLLTFIIYQLESWGEPNFQVTQLDNPAPGYLIFDWVFAQSFFAVDNYGYSVLEKTPSDGYKSPYFKQLINGLWAVVSGRKIFLYDKNMVLVDSLTPPPQYKLDFHDIIALKNGNYLLLCTEEIVTDLSKEVEGGFTNAIVIYNVIVEINSVGTIFWEWKSYDHMQISDVTEGVNLRKNVIDLIHINSLFETNDGNILVSIRHYDEISLINKSTGEFIWRMGGSKSKRNQFNFINDDINGFFGFSHQHTAQILPNGNLLLYDNGNLKFPMYSRAVEYSIDVFNKTATKVWEYRNNPDMFQAAMGSVQRLANNNTLINWGGGLITEVKPDKSIALEITNYAYIYRAYKISSIANATSRLINAPGEYNFNSEGNNTGVSVTVSNISTGGETSIQKHDYPPHTGHYNDSSFTQIYPYRWVFSRNKAATISGKFKISKASVPEIANPAKTTIYKRDKEAVGEFYPIKTTYNSVTGDIIGDFQGFGEFVLVSNALATPILITPISGTQAVLSGKMTWQHVTGVEKYHIQIDTVGDFSKPMTDLVLSKHNSYDYVGYKETTKYYWRVRATNTKDTSAWSNIFSFTTISPPPYLIYPNDKMIGVTLSDSLKWHRQAAHDIYLVQISKTNDFKNPVVNSPSYTRSAFPLENLEHNTQYFWRVLVNHPSEPSAWSAVRSFTTTFETPTLIKPNNGLLNVSIPAAFSWSLAINVNAFTIQISETIDFKNIVYEKDDITQKYIDVSTLTNDKNYFWRVRAQKDNIFSDWSDIFMFTTQLKSPKLTSPTNNKNDVQLSSNLTWELTELNINYVLQISQTSDFSNLVIDTILNSQNNFPINKLELASTYYWRVKAKRNDSESIWSNTWMFSTALFPKLDTPRQIYPWNYFYAYVEGFFSWNSVATATKYRLQVAKDLDFLTLEMDIVLDKDTTEWYSNFDYEKTYFWRVKALNDNDSSEWSSTWRLTTMAKVYIVTLSNPSNDMLQVPVSGRLQWNYVPATETYRIQVSENEFFDETYIDTEINNLWWHNYSDLKHNTQYFWRVRFKRDGVLSDWSNVWTFRTATEDSLSSPRTVSPFEFAGVHPPNGVQLTWNEVPEADSYQISISANRSFDQLIAKININQDTTYNFAELDYKNFYYWRVSAVNSKTQSAWSSVRSFYTYLEIPEIVYPGDQSIGIPYDGKLEWNYNDTNNYFRIQISKNNEFNEANIVLELDSIRQFSHHYILEPNQSYFMRIRTYDYFNRSVWSDPISFSTGSTSNVYDILHNYGIAVFPNPATDFVQILASGIKHYKIVDVLGNIVVQKAVELVDDIRIDLSAIPNGVYFVIVNNNEYRSMFIKRD